MGILGVLKKGTGALLILLVSVLSYFLFQEKLDTIVIPVIGIDFKHFYSFFLYFLSGTVFYLYRKRISFNWIGLIVCVIIAVLIKTNYISGLLFVFIMPYLIFMLAFCKKFKMNRIGQYGDFSFGIFLYAFPIQQLIVYFFHKDIGVLSMIVLSFVFTAPFAILSWKFIEKPALGLRKKINLRIPSRRINTSDEATKR